MESRSCEILVSTKIPFCVLNDSTTHKRDFFMRQHKDTFLHG